MLTSAANSEISKKARKMQNVSSEFDPSSVGDLTACPALDALYQPKGTIFILLVMIQLGMKSTSPTGCAIPSQKGSTGDQLEKMKKAKKITGGNIRAWSNFRKSLIFFLFFIILTIK